MRGGRRDELAKGLAHAFLAGGWTEPQLLVRGGLAVARIAREEGFRVNDRKSQLLSRAGAGDSAASWSTSTRT